MITVNATRDDDAALARTAPGQLDPPIVGVVDARVGRARAAARPSGGTARRSSWRVAWRRSGPLRSEGPLGPSVTTVRVARCLVGFGGFVEASVRVSAAGIGRGIGVPARRGPRIAGRVVVVGHDVDRPRSSHAWSITAAATLSTTRRRAGPRSDCSIRLRSAVTVLSRSS